MHSCSINN